jgi:hypothetical protein
LFLPEQSSRCVWGQAPFLPMQQIAYSIPGSTANGCSHSRVWYNVRKVARRAGSFPMGGDFRVFVVFVAVDDHNTILRGRS